MSSRAAQDGPSLKVDMLQGSPIMSVKTRPTHFPRGSSVSTDGTNNLFHCFQ